MSTPKRTARIRILPCDLGHISTAFVRVANTFPFLAGSGIKFIPSKATSLHLSESQKVRKTVQIIKKVEFAREKSSYYFEELCKGSFPFNV